MATEITREELATKLDRRENVVLVEALPPMYYEDAHLPGAINMPHDQVDQLTPALLPDPSAEIVVYCANSPCRNSGIAARRLTELGYDERARLRRRQARLDRGGAPHRQRRDGGEPLNGRSSSYGG